jgi:hypothetical protein
MVKEVSASFCVAVGEVLTAGNEVNSGYLGVYTLVALAYMVAVKGAVNA